MTEDADRLCALLEGRDRRVPTGPDRALLALGADITHAFSSWRLQPQERERLFARSIAMADHGSRSTWRYRITRLRPQHLGHRTSALLGGTAVVAVAAIGITVVHRKRGHSGAAA